MDGPEQPTMTWDQKVNAEKLVLEPCQTQARPAYGKSFVLARRRRSLSGADATRA